MEEIISVRPLTILIIEDDENDILLFRMALEREGIKNPIQIVHNGKEAIAYLEGDGKFADRARFPFPGVVFTDLKMPVLGGFGLLEWLKAHLTCRLLPTMVFSSSDNKNDVEKAYSLGANAYVVKPNSLPALRKLVRTAHEFWTNCEKPELKE